MSDADLATRLAELQKDIDEGRLKPEDVRGDQLDGIEDGTYHAAVSGFEVLDDAAADEHGEVGVMDGDKR